MPSRKQLEPFYEHLGSALRGARLEANLSQTKVGAVLDMHPTSVHYYEKGTNRMRVLELVQFCQLYGVEASEVLDKAITEASGTITGAQK